MTPVFTQQLLEPVHTSHPAGATNPVTVFPWVWSPSSTNLGLFSIRLSSNNGEAFAEGNQLTINIYQAYGISGTEELIHTFTHTFNATNAQSSTYTKHFSTSSGIPLPTVQTTDFAILNPYVFGSNDYGIQFHTTITTPNEGLTSTVSAITTEFSTGSNANKYWAIFGDFPITVGGTAVTSQSPNQISSSGGTITVAHGLNSTSDFSGSTPSWHRKVELIDSNGNDIFPNGSAVSGASVNINNITTASTQFAAFNAGDVFTLKVTIGSGLWNSPTDDFRIVRYEEDFTVV